MSDDGGCCGPGGCGPQPDRREFLGAASVAAFGLLRARGLQDPGQDHFVPADKGLTPEWIAQLTRPGAAAPWQGEQLRTIGMPCGGIAAGQLYVTGDGRLAQWWIANDACHTSYGGQTTIETPTGEQGVCYGTFAPAMPVEQGTLLAWRPAGAAAQVLALDAATFPATTCRGEYPVATIDYRGRDAVPLQVTAEVFAPFVPLDARASAMPCTLLRYTVHNTGGAPLTVTLAPFLQNPVLRGQRGRLPARLRNVAVTQDRFVGVAMEAIDAAPSGEPEEAEVVFADFEQGYGDWHVERGDAFGGEPAAGTLPDQQEVSGYEGRRLVNTYRDRDRSTGVLVSPEFTIEQPFIAFRIGGGKDLQELALTLELVTGGERQRVRAATGRNSERLREDWWDVSDLLGKRAVLTVRDGKTGAWGHVNVDDIRFRPTPPPSARFSQVHPQAGQVALVAFAADARTIADAGTTAALRERLSAAVPGGDVPATTAALDRPPLGAVVQTVELAPGATATLTFAVTWCFPHRRQRTDEFLAPGERCGEEGPRVGNRYGNWFRSALGVAQRLEEQLESLTAATFAFRDALHRDTTLPGWFVRRLAAPLSTMATATLQWWEDGRVWAWEGVGCCPGTCGHVWNYAQGMAWLFPELERSVRERQDFAAGVGLHDDGAIGFRGRPENHWAGDAQAGYVLKAWREHRLSADDAFLTRVWPQVREVLGFLLQQDGAEPDGLLEGRQHNTYDIDFYGGNTMVGSLYLAALRAGAAMARRRGDDAFAERCEQLARRGAEVTMQRLWNGEYFTQQIPADKRDEKYQYGDGCLSDQLLGQWFADQIGLGYLYPREAVRTALQSIWRYNWAPDVGPQTRAHEPERDFAVPGEAGLFTCTWPKSEHRGRNGVRYRDEVWTGIEYQVAAHLLREGFVTEGLAIVRGVDERYDGRKHNPFNEVECGDHYARALASWSCLLAASGFEFDGPAGVLGFAPRLQPEDFRSCFVAGTLWGTIAQQRQAGRQIQTVVPRHGQATLRTLRFEVAAGRRVQRAEVSVGGDSARTAAAPVVQDGLRVEVRPAQPLELASGPTPEASAAVVTLHLQ